jgi:hypothetical protein
MIMTMECQERDNHIMSSTYMKMVHTDIVRKYLYLKIFSALVLQF